MITSLFAPSAGLGQAVGSGKLVACSEGALLQYGVPCPSLQGLLLEESAPGLGAANPGEATGMSLALPL